MKEREGPRFLLLLLLFCLLEVGRPALGAVRFNFRINESKVTSMKGDVFKFAGQVAPGYK